jgi:subtilase family serine protease
MLAPSKKPSPKTPRRRPECEALEARDLMTVGIGTPPLHPYLIPVTNPNPLSNSLTPAQVRHAYGFDQIGFLQGNYNGLAGQGETIAIVDPFDDPTIAGDLKQFDRQFGLPDPTLTVVNQTGGSALPAKGNSNQTSEVALDVEWAHAMAPAAKILLVEFNSLAMSDFAAAVDFARKQPGVAVVSASFGRDNGLIGEASNNFNSTFTTPAGHTGVSFVAASGDNGVFQYPAGSPNVLGVGGTMISLNGDNSIRSETAWSGSGGGVDPYQAVPAYQQGLGLSNRGTPDVAYAGGSNFAIYDSAYNTGWEREYGTSAGAPQWSSLVALIDQARARAGLASLDGATQLLPSLYALPADDFNDITSGSNKGASAGPGYDQVTGRGTPHADRIVNDLTWFTATTNGDLSVYGDKAGVANDVVTVGTNPSGGVSVTENGRTLSFARGLLSSVSIAPRQGNNQVFVNAVPAGVTVNVNGAYLGNDTVTVGNGSLAAVAGPVNVSNTSGKTALTIDDSADGTSRQVTVTNGSVQFSGLSKVSYSGGITSLKVLGGSGNDGFFVNSTASGTPVSVVTGAGQNSVWVGTGGSLAGIASAVNVQHANASGATSLVIDDYKESGRSATISSSAVNFTGVPTITYSSIDALTVVGASGSNTIAVNSLPSGVSLTVYNTRYNTLSGALAPRVTRYYGVPIWDLSFVAYAPFM